MMTTLTLPNQLIERVFGLAQKHSTTVENFIEEAISHEAERRETEAFFTERRTNFDAEAFRQALAAIPAIEPDENDRL